MRKEPQKNKLKCGVVPTERKKTMDTNAKLTQRAFYKDAINFFEGKETTFSITELNEFAQSRIAKLDEVNAKRKEAPKKETPKQAAARAYDASLMERIANELLGEEPIVRTVVAEALDITPSKASTLLNKLVAAGTAAKVSVKGEKGKLNAYTRA